jgi:type II secretory pathway pseudopilin PulG
MHRTRSRTGYLLIELVAAVVLIAAATAALLPSLAGRSEAARRAELIQRFVDFDRRARLLSLREGPVRLTTDADGASLRVGAVHDEVPALRAPADGWTLHLLDAGSRREVPSVTIDRLGRSDDYLVLLDRNGTRLTLRFDGRTGRLVTTEAAP